MVWKQRSRRLRKQAPERKSQGHKPGINEMHRMQKGVVSTHSIPFWEDEWEDIPTLLAALNVITF
jgi:hypothetical protein